MACHPEGATRSKSVPKAKATEESPVQAGEKGSFDLNRQKHRPCCLKGKILRRPMILEPAPMYGA
jgi:hypothetical protein